MNPRVRLLAALAGVVFFAAHVRNLPRTLEDLDSLNFALAVEKFDVGAHRPHPPGYPVYVVLAKASTGVVHAVAPSWDRDHAAAAGLAALGLVAGTLATYVLTAFWIAVGLPPVTALFAAILAVVSPLFWFTAARPLTDTPSLVAALAVQTELIRGLRGLREAGPSSWRSRWIVSAFCAGLLVGVRSQSMWLTGPLLVWFAGELIVRHRARAAAWLVGAAAAGALLWAVPLVWMSGGLSRYLSLLGSQGASDFGGVEMLATAPTVRLLRTALYRTFVWPWSLPLLADVVLGLAALGVVRLARRDRRALMMILLAWLPYLLFHLTYQESLTLRYALPIVVPVAALAVVALAVLRAPLAAAPVAMLCAASLWIVQPRLHAFAEDGSAVFRGFQDMVRALPSMSEPPMLHMHHQVWWGVQRELDWFRPSWNFGPQPHPGAREWLLINRHWLSGTTRPVWFLTDLSRTDIAVFDPRSRHRRGRYELSSSVRALMPGPRLEDFDWWELRQPVWMLGSGWALTPEIAGMTATDTTGPHRRPADAFLLRGSSPLSVMIGGRYLPSEGNPAGTIVVELDGRAVDRWGVSADAPWFVHWIDLPSGAGGGEGPYAHLTVRVESAESTRPAPTIGLEQFDAGGPDAVMAAFADGWQEPEEDPKTGRLWRWTSDRSVLEIRAATDVTLTVAGESPLKSFDRAPEVVVRAGNRELARFSPSTDFVQQVRVPLAALTDAHGRVSIETSLTFVPADRGRSADRRRLGLRLHRVDVN